MGLGSCAVEEPAERRAASLRFLELKSIFSRESAGSPGDEKTSRVRRPEQGGKAMKLTATQVAEKIGATVEGDGACELTGVAAPERAGQKDLI